MKERKRTFQTFVSQLLWLPFFRWLSGGLLDFLMPRKKRNGPRHFRYQSRFLRSRPRRSLFWLRPRPKRRKRKNFGIF